LNKNWKKLEDATAAVADLSIQFCGKLVDAGFDKKIVAYAADAFVAHIVNAIVNEMFLTQLSEEQAIKSVPSYSS